MSRARSAAGPGAVEAWLRRIPIRRRIFLLLGVNLAIACVLLGLAWRHEAAQERFQRRLEARYALDFELQRIERDSERLKGLVRQYFVRPEPALQAEVRRLGEDLGRRIEESALPDPGIRGRLRAARAALRQLVAGFDALVELDPQIIGAYEARVLKAGRETSGLFAIIRGTLRVERTDLLAPSLGKAHEAFVGAMLNLNAFYLRRDAGSRAEAKASLGRIASAVPVMLDLAATELQREALAAIGARTRALEEELEHLAAMFERQRRVLDEDVDLGARRLTALIESILGESDERRMALRAAHARERAFALAMLGALAALVIAAGAATSWTIARSIRRPLGALMGTVAAFAAGDLSRDVEEPAAPDEVGDLARMLQVFRANALARGTAEDALRRSEEQYRSVVDNATEGIVIVQDQLMVFANPRVLAISGYAPDEVVGHWFLEYVHPDDRPEALRGVRRIDHAAVAGADHVRHLRLLTRAGHWVVLEVKSVEVDWRGRPASLNLFTDVTRRVRLEEDLRRTLIERELILENSIVGIIFVDAEARVQWLNRAAEQLFAVDRTAQIGRTMESIFLSRSEFERMRDAVLAAARTGRAYEAEVQLRRADGSLVWVLASGKLTDPRDPRSGRVWVVRDITPRKLLEAELRRASSEREAILNNTLVGVTLSVNRVHQWVNRRFAEMLGFEPAELVGNSSRIHFPDDASHEALGREAYPRIATHGAYSTECRMRRKDGTLIWVELHGQAIDRHDLARGTIWTFVDVTGRKALEDAVQRTSAERGAILNNTLVGITFSVNRRRVWVNPRFCEMTGYAADELIGRTSRLHFEDDASFERFGGEAYAALAAAGTYAAELPVRRKDGSRMWLELYGASLYPGRPEQGVIWTAVDVTRRHAAEESMRVALEKQRELSDLKSRFVSMTSHEFRTPLATILSSAELLRDYGERLAPGERTELLGSIRNSVRRMAGMLDQVLVIGRAEAGRLEFKPGPVDVEALCRRVIREAEHADGHAAGAPSRVALRFAGACGGARFDERLLQHILGNLVSNALKYSPDGAPVALEVTCNGERAVFTVSDAGIGIPEEDLPHLFETFHRARNVGNIAGTGLGLAIVKKAVDLHGGTIALASAPGRGTRFTVTLPNAAHG
ncbi:MAG: PAS domain S-box protein [Burkholderiales bacterium]|nr:PAS domain S-box protein [Burkholderiales bacterium]